MKRTLMIFAVAASLFAACTGSDSIDNSIWINDPDDFCLPKYSEWGYNTFGAVMGGAHILCRTGIIRFLARWSGTAPIRLWNLQ